jgi:hypothetical protein
MITLNAEQEKLLKDLFDAFQPGSVLAGGKIYTAAEWKEHTNMKGVENDKRKVRID